MLKQAIAGLAFVSACATASAVSSERLISSEGSIRAAEEVGADRVPTASLQLRLAKEEIQQAKQLLKDGNKAKAERVLAKAQADADYAMALAKEAPLRAEANEASERMKALQNNGN